MSDACHVDAKAREIMGLGEAGGSAWRKGYAKKIAAALRETQEAVLEEAASIARGNVYKQHYRTWPHWNPEGNLANEDQATRLADATADAILALIDKKG
jgi:hypothetical protein